MIGKVTLRNALGVLAKSSRYAVEVEGGEQSELEGFKDYMYIESPIEKAFEQRLESLKEGEIVFLCGSSGDGKSAIMARHHKLNANRIRFHLDATHSFSPTENAVQALDKLFTEVKRTGVPLAVGINIGMLANYAKEGAFEHQEIKTAMAAFLRSEALPPPHHFLSFSQYPKFQLSAEGGGSAFVTSLLQRLTNPSATNPFYRLFTDRPESQADPQLEANFHLLSDDGVQKVVIQNLLRIRLLNDQFLTARALLDFFHHLLTADGYLFDNMFSQSDNELAQRVREYDPARLRHREIDDFILRFGLRLEDKDFYHYVNELEHIGIKELEEASSYIRLFFLMQYSEFGNDYHHIFKTSFSDSLIRHYTMFWSWHKELAETGGGKIPQKNELKGQFYKEVFVEALTRYINRNARLLKKRHLLIGRRGNFDLAAYVEIQPDFPRAEQNPSDSISYFYVFFKANGEEMPLVKMDANLLDLMLRIRAGYRPSKHDKSVIVIMEEIVETIIDKALQEKSIYIYSREQCLEFKLLEDETIEVEGSN